MVIASAEIGCWYSSFPSTSNHVDPAGNLGERIGCPSQGRKKRKVSMDKRRANDRENRCNKDLFLGCCVLGCFFISWASRCFYFFHSPSLHFHTSTNSPDPKKKLDLASTGQHLKINRNQCLTTRSLRAGSNKDTTEPCQRRLRSMCLPSSA